MFNNNSNNKFQ